ncbi:hypothetical protein Dimus_023222 [Dionaea muscipula]
MVADRITPATATANHRSSPTSTSIYPQAPAASSSAPMDPVDELGSNNTKAVSIAWLRKVEVNIGSYFVSH